MPPRITTRFTFLFLGLLLTAFGARAGDTLRVAAPFFHLDRANHLLLVNQDAEDLNQASPRAKTHLQLPGEVYTFDRPVGPVQTDSAYLVQGATASYRLFFTQLPVVHLDTRHPIADTPSVYAEFRLVEASGLSVSASLGVEYRGGSSQGFPKKSFELSFWADTTGSASRDVSLLGMRTDNKYNLQALYNEPLRFRSRVANALWQQVHQIYYQAQEPDAKNGIAMEYAEVFVNGEYRGVYALSERIDRKQLKLKKYTTEINGELYKGADWGSAATFTWLPPYDNHSDTWGGFEYKHPEEEIDWANLSGFVGFVLYSTDTNFYRDYQQKFHLGNAVDYFIFLNLTRALDNTGKNIYIARYKKNEPYYYVPWDLDGVFGTDWQGQNTGSVNDLLTNGFYDRLLRDCASNGFRDQLLTRWTALRASVITAPKIMAQFRADYDYFHRNNVYERERLAWSGYQHDTTQLAYLDAWLRQRLGYLDGVFGQSCSGVTAARPAHDAPALQLYPNPAHDYVLVECAAASYELSIRDLQGRVVRQQALKGPQNRLSTQGLARGVYAVTIRSATQVVTRKLVVE